jgi:hypothetical protein
MMMYVITFYLFNASITLTHEIMNSSSTVLEESVHQ